jgi:hypothetical protein
MKASVGLLWVAILGSHPAGAQEVETGGIPFLENRPAWLDAGATTEIEREGESGRIRVTFGGVLESASTLSGPWIPVAGAASPYTTDPRAALGFFRSITSESAGVFSSRSVVDFRVTGALQTHFDLAFAGSPDGIFPPRRLKPYFGGSVSIGNTTVNADLRIRGNSSLQECPFPKLKFKVSRANREGTPFAEAREIKIGTHCAEGGRGNIGRLRDERATYREALAYETMELLGFLTPRVRRARITFHDTSPVDAPNPGGWTVTRNALLLEDPEVVAERLGGHALDDEELTALTDARFGAQLITDLQMLHVLLGNWDFTLSEDGRGLWNTDVIRFADGTYLPMPGDFDLCSFVTELVRSTTPRDYHPELPERVRQVRYELGEIRRQVASPVFDAARGRYLAKREALTQGIAAAVVDEEGRANALMHVASFYDGLAATE